MRRTLVRRTRSNVLSADAWASALVGANAIRPATGNNPAITARSRRLSPSRSMCFVILLYPCAYRHRIVYHIGTVHRMPLLAKIQFGRRRHAIHGPSRSEGGDRARRKFAVLFKQAAPDSAVRPMASMIQDGKEKPTHDPIPGNGRAGRGDAAANRVYGRRLAWRTTDPGGPSHSDGAGDDDAAGVAGSARPAAERQGRDG